MASDENHMVKAAPADKCFIVVAPVLNSVLLVLHDASLVHFALWGKLLQILIGCLLTRRQVCATKPN